MKIYLLLGHTDTETLSGAFANKYEQHAKAAGHTVRRQNIGDMRFDPVLHKGYKEIQELEPDLKTFCDDIHWADHIVIVHPTWWCSMPSLLKGLFDRAWLPHEAFLFEDHGLTWAKLLKGRTARIITSANMNPWIMRFMYGSPTMVLEMVILRFAGIRARSTVFGPSERVSARAKERWLRRVARLGANAR
ncbi:NADPH:quinone reductase [Candidatus Kaiserbacteria bacterium CG10_big_fil_rev_8_21_14_0_10_56_12]|uniref:NADPH:quinone reductase n=1 Tax=Candidatus Kaiserbacteria bacterium CG10_big_fil_rev_8_21_14_0_10_56_12 TaxID=1974611 RepID=A0A2H0UA67_9BACT|nr:MAG: NADPH:quinone reductase [Candidatus Kaiserbacteria bacterium CG10_big_fil_rev_8_21_14_0_10_56_12]